MRHTLLYAGSSIIVTVIALNTAMAQSGTEGANDVVITEIMYNPPEAGTDSLEFIELYNPNSTAAINLGGYYFSSGFIYTFPPDVMLPAEDVLILAKDSVAFTGVSGIPARQWDSQSLLNTGEAITLRNFLDIVVDTVNYNDNAPWPPEADGLGASIVLCDVNADNNDGNNWAASQQASGIIINNIEIFADPEGIEECLPVSIDDPVDSGSFLLHPNPNNGTFEVFLNDGQQDIVIELYDVSGKVVHSEPVGSQGNASIQLDPGVRNGIYILRVGEAYSRVIICR